MRLQIWIFKAFESCGTPAGIFNGAAVPTGQIGIMVSSKSRTLVLLLVASTCAATASGVIYPVIVLRMEHLQVPGWMIGLIQSVWALPIVLLGHFYPKISARFGETRSIAAGMLLPVISLILMPVFVNPYTWLALQFLNGFAFGQFWVLSETWLSRNAPAAARGRIMALYALVPALGATAGPAMATFTGFADYKPFVLAGAFLALGTASVMWSGRLSPAKTEATPASPFAVVWFAPSIFVVALASGIFETVPWALLPLFGLRSGLSEDASSLLLTAFFSGQIVLGLLIGWMADRAGKRPSFLVVSSVALVGSLILPALVDTPLLVPVLFVWGAATQAFYAIGLAMIGSRFSPRVLPSANSVFVILYSFGSFVGPPVVGLSMDRAGPFGFSASLAISAAAALVAVGLSYLAFKRFSKMAQAHRRP